MTLDVIELTQSRFLLAKYRIEIDEVLEESQESPKVPKSADENFAYEHCHEGPEAIEYKKTDCFAVCDKENCMQLLWAFWLPCIYANYCIISCLNKVLDVFSETVTNLEERHTMKWCICCCPFNN